MMEASFDPAKAEITDLTEIDGGISRGWDDFHGNQRKLTEIDGE